MKFSTKVSPNIRDREHKTAEIMGELSVGLLFIFAFSMVFYYQEYGFEYVLHGAGLMAISIITALATETLYAAFMKKDIKYHIKNSFPLVTAIILTLTVQINTSYFAIAVATFFAIFFGKLVFGGFGHNIFNPAGVGRMIIFSTLTGSTAADVMTGATPITSMADAGWIIKDSAVIEKFLEQFGGLWNLFIGWYPGAIGETSTLLILIVCAYLGYRKVLDWKVPVVYIGSVFIFTTIIALTNGVGMWYPMFHILSGGLAFGAAFMATDPVTNPTTISGRIIFAIGLGALTVLIRLKSNLPGGVIYALLIMNMVSPLLDKLTDDWSIYAVKKHTMAIGSALVMGIVITFFAGNGLEAKAVVFPTEEGEAEDIPVTLGDPVKIFSDSTADLPEILEKTEEGSIVTYKLSVPGYAFVEHDGAPNMVQVKLNKETKTVESVLVTEATDTPSLGSNVAAKTFVEQFKGISFDDTEAAVDAVSGATVSSKAIAKAVRVAILDLNK